MGEEALIEICKLGLRAREFKRIQAGDLIKSLSGNLATFLLAEALFDGCLFNLLPQVLGLVERPMLVQKMHEHHGVVDLSFGHPFVFFNVLHHFLCKSTVPEFTCVLQEKQQIFGGLRI